MKDKPLNVFYRVTKTNPPTDKDYVTRYERLGEPPEDISEELRESYKAHTAFDTVEGARDQARQVPGIGKYIFRYDIPEDAKLIWKQTLGPGHYDIWGDKEELKRYLTGYVADVYQPNARQSGWEP